MTTFPVAAVELKEVRLPTEPMHESAERVLNDSPYATALRSMAAKRGRKVGDDMWKEWVKPTIEACSDRDGLVVAQPGYHPLIAAAHLAFAHHLPLRLTPDAVWVTIINGLATHVGLNSEEYRSFLVGHQDKKTIDLERNGFVMGKPDNDWPRAFEEFSLNIKQQAGEKAYDLAVANFSTTGPVEKAACEVALMNLVRSYYDFQISSACGIPSITLDGTTADWEQLLERVRALRQLPNLNWWLDSVEKFAQQCVAACRGNADPKYWERFYKHKEESGGDHVNGYLLQLLPYVNAKRLGLIKNPVVEKADSTLLSHENLPTSFGRVSFIWDYFGQPFDYEFLGGVLAVEQDPTTLVVAAKLGWAVRPVTPPDVAAQKALAGGEEPAAEADEE